MRHLTCALVAGVALTACVAGEPEDGGTIFAAECAGCHGADARGNGPMAAGLPVSPPDLTGLSAGNGGVFPRDHVMSTIDGYSRGPHGAQVMPEFGAGDLGEMVIVEDDEGHGIPVPSRLLMLANYLESLQEP